MKTKLLILISLIALSCKKDEIKQTSSTSATCDCYERHEAIDTYLGANGQTQLAWLFQYNTTTQPDLCSKETEVWVYSGNPTQFRYKVICQ
jgi:hypothetical protein